MKINFRNNLSRMLHTLHQAQLLQPVGRPADREAIRKLEQVIDQTDPRIRLTPGYRRRLQAAIQLASAYIDRIVGEIPSSIEITSYRFTSDQRVNAFFATPGELQRALAKSPELVAYHREHNGFDSEACWALLCMQMQEKEILGMDLSGDAVRRDVRQVAVNFFDHRFQSPGPDEATVRAGLRHCMFQGLIENACGRLTEQRSDRQRLETRRRILLSRLREQQRGGRGTQPVGLSDLSRLKAQLADTEQGLQRLGLLTPANSLEQVAGVFAHPEAFIRIQRRSLTLDKMGIRVRDDYKGPCNHLQLAQVEIEQRPHRIVVLARLAPSDLEAGRRHMELPTRAIH